MARLFFSLLILLLTSSAFTQEPQLIGSIRIGNANTLFGYRILPLGDQNGDGFDDILVYELRSSPDPQVFETHFFYGGVTTNSTPFLTIHETNGYSNNIGDINGDGVDEILIPGRWPEDFKLGLFYGGSQLDSIRDFWFGSDSLRAIGFSIRGFDIDLSGADEIISREYDQRSVLLFEIGSAYDTLPDLILTPPNLTPLDYGTMANSIISGDFNGDGKIDCALNVSPRATKSLNGMIYLYWGGAGFDTIPDLIITRPGEYAVDQEMFGKILTSLGDFNGDTFDDFYAAAGPTLDTTGMIYFGGPGIDNIPDIIIPEKSEHVKLAGDINNDGYNDMITSYPVSSSTFGKVNIYYGGPSADSIADIVYFNALDPRYQTEFGEDCAGIGDFNGDGVDDFAYSFQTSGGVGEVYVYAGINTSTNIEINYEPIIPDNFELKQNYPNPFNPSTTIEFAIPTKERVTLTVYNILGQAVTTLLDKELPAGSYSINWDGTNCNGQQIASGIYFYRLLSNPYSAYKSLVFIK